MPREEGDTVLPGVCEPGPEDEEESLDPKVGEEEDEDQETIEEEYDIYVEDELDEFEQDESDGEEDVRPGDFFDNDDDFWEEADAEESPDDQETSET